jgi:polysaccharide pyruvyl transferase WcaK-like protein
MWNLMKKILVVSFFKSNNLGDLALSSAIENLLRNKGYYLIKYDFSTVTPVTKDVTMTSANNNSNNEIKPISIFRLNSSIKIVKNIVAKLIGTSKIESVYYLFNVMLSKKWRNFKRDLKSTDVLVLAGGNMIMDARYDRSIISFWPIIFKSYCALASRYKKEVYITYVGVGPINNKESKKIYHSALKYVKKISVRDPLSKQLCEELITDRPIIQTVDPVFSLPIDYKKYRIERIKDLSIESIIKIGICVLGEPCFSSKREYRNYLEGIYKLVINVSKKSVKKIEFILFSTETADYESIDELNEKFNSHEYLDVKITYLHRVDQVFEFYKELNFLIGGRMHSLIFAQICLLPFIGIVWQNKLKGFAEVVCANDRIYNINSFIKESNYITNQIIRDISDLDLISKMAEVNSNLNELVHKGNIL